MTGRGKNDSLSRYLLLLPAPLPRAAPLVLSPHFSKYNTELIGYCDEMQIAIISQLNLLPGERTLASRDACGSS